MRIRDDQLYIHGGYTTFEDACRDEFGLSVEDAEEIIAQSLEISDKILERDISEN